MSEANIFTNTPVQFAMSTKHDGHMSFGKVSDEETYKNINTFIDTSLMGRQHVGFIKVTYDGDRTYDTIKSVPPNTSRDITDPNSIVSDALITTQTATALLLPVADCYPFVLYDPHHAVLALAHLGWQASHAQLLRKLVQQLKNDYQTNPTDLLVYAGPGIRAQHYVFPDAVQKDMPEWQDYLIQTDGGYGIDLLGFNLHELKQVGVPESNIEVSPRNTVDDPDLESHYQHHQAGLAVARRYLFAAMMTSEA
jgi:copper oxidase (laccase) domain-containing protein